MKSSIKYAPAVALIFSLCAPSYADETTPLSFAIVPQQSATKLAKLWAPILRYIGEKSGCALKFRTAKDIPTFEDRLLSGEYDLAYMNPYHYTLLHEKQGYLAFAKQRDKLLAGVIVTRTDGDIREIAQLDSATLCFPSPAAFAASMLPRAFLQSQGLHFTAKYVSSHDSVYRNVAMGRYPAGGGIQRTFNNIDKKIRDQFTFYIPHQAIHLMPLLTTRALLAKA
jgi:phosphonate transport system substrate-binding protein